MNWKQLHQYIVSLSTSQLEMDVIVLIDNNYHHLTAALHIDKDWREANPVDDDFVPYAEDQPILT